MYVFFFFFFQGKIVIFFFFFFQAEDGIRDFHVTGVQTCALPICPEISRPSPCSTLQRTPSPTRPHRRGRKSVVKGKSVDLGGRRIIKKKKKKKKKKENNKNNKKSRNEKKKKNN